jgi:hypothetical protein
LFYANYRKGEALSQSTEAGNAFRVTAGLWSSFSKGMYSFKDDNYTHSESGGGSAVYYSSIFLAGRWQFSTFENCRESYVLDIEILSNENMTVIEYTNFISNRLSNGVVNSRSIYGYPIRNCIFEGNSATTTFINQVSALYGGQVGVNFTVTDCVFDQEPSGAWTSSGTGNIFGITTATISIGVTHCYVTYYPPRTTPASLSPLHSHTYPASPSESASPRPSYSPSLSRSPLPTCPPPVMKGRALIRYAPTGTCEALIHGAIFTDLTYVDGSGGAIYIASSTVDLFIEWSHFDDCEALMRGGAIFIELNRCRMNNTCFSYCYSPDHGQFVSWYLISPATQGVICDHCLFYASYRRDQNSSTSTGHAFQITAAYSFAKPDFQSYFGDDNHTRGDSASGTTAVVSWEVILPFAIHRFSTFENCSETFVLQLSWASWYYSDLSSECLVEYTNFLWNNLTSSVVSSSNEIQIQNSLFIGNLAPMTFSVTNSISFKISNCIFDSIPSGVIETSMVTILANSSFSTIEIGRIFCLFPITPPSSSLTVFASKTQTPGGPTASFTPPVFDLSLRREILSLGFWGFLLLFQW